MSRDNFVANLVRLVPPREVDPPEAPEPGCKDYPRVVLEGDFVPEHAIPLSVEDAGRFELEIEWEAWDRLQKADLQPGRMVHVETFEQWAEHLGPAERPPVPVDELGPRPDDDRLAAQVWVQDARELTIKQHPWLVEREPVHGRLVDVRWPEGGDGVEPSEVVIETCGCRPPAARHLPDLGKNVYVVSGAPELVALAPARFLTPGTEIEVEVLRDRLPGAELEAHAANINSVQPPLQLEQGLGSRPTSNVQDLKLWNEGARSVVEYRQKWMVQEATTLLGERPATDEQHVHRAAVARTVARTRSLIERSVVEREVAAGLRALTW